MKPKMKSEIAAGRFSVEWGWLQFCATPDAASEFEEFGMLDKHQAGDWYTLWVDARYDLLEIYRYIKEYSTKSK